MLTTAAAVSLGCLVVLSRASSFWWVEPGSSSPTVAEPGLRRWAAPLAVLAGAGAWAAVGGIAGPLAAGVGGSFAYVVLARAEPPDVVRRRRVLRADAPVAVGLLAAVLASGSPVGAALEAVARGFPGPVADDLRSFGHRLAIGVDPVVVWRDADGPWRLLGRVLARAHETGASVVPAVERAADEMAAAAAQDRTRAARSVEVRVAAPLGLCFLPAFVLLGIVPLVAGLLGSLGPFA